MYLYIPLGIFVISVTVIVWIVSRKFVYLKKLEPKTVEASSADIGFWEEMFPEATSGFKKIKIRQFGVNILSELEKILRKLRLLSLKIDTLTGKLIHRVRKSTQKHEAIIDKEGEREEDNKPQEIDPFDLGSSTKEELKQKEQYLIIEIAKNPKDALLYRELGSLYMRTGELEDAKESFEKALDLEPDENTKRKLGRVMAKLEEKPRP